MQINKVSLCPKIPFLCCVFLISGCTGMIKPTQDIETAEQAIKQAKDGYVSMYAREEIDRAEKHLENAQKKLEAKQYDEAKQHAQMAISDVDYAEAKASTSGYKRMLKEHEILLETTKKIYKIQLEKLNQGE